MTKEEFMEEWGVKGMPLDKKRLANAAWDEATEAAAEELRIANMRLSGRKADGSLIPAKPFQQP